MFLKASHMFSVKSSSTINNFPGRARRIKDCAHTNTDIELYVLTKRGFVHCTQEATRQPIVVCKMATANINEHETDVSVSEFRIRSLIAITDPESEGAGPRSPGR